MTNIFNGAELGGATGGMAPLVFWSRSIKKSWKVSKSKSRSLEWHQLFLPLFGANDNNQYYSLNLTWFSPLLSVTAFPALTSLYLFRTLALATLSYDDAHNIVTTCTNLKRLALDCDFYGRAIRHIISSLAPTLEVNMKTTKKSICFHEFFLEVVKK